MRDCKVVAFAAHNTEKPLPEGRGCRQRREYGELGKMKEARWTPRNILLRRQRFAYAQRSRLGAARVKLRLLARFQAHLQHVDFFAQLAGIGVGQTALLAHKLNLFKLD